MTRRCALRAGHVAGLIFLALSLFALCALAHAQTSSKTVSLTISWTPPTTAGGGTQPLTGPNVLTGYNVYISTSALSAVPVTPTASVTAASSSTSASFSALVGQTLYIYVTALDSSGPSGLSTPATYQIPVEGFAPDIPTQVTVKITVGS